VGPNKPRNTNSKGVRPINAVESRTEEEEPRRRTDANLKALVRSILHQSNRKARIEIAASLEAIPLALGLEESRPATTLHAHSIWTGFLALDQWPLEQLGQQQ